MLEGLSVVDHMRLPPQGAGTVRALSRIGYKLPEALADLIDNSIDADARRVEITFHRTETEITAVTIADDGRGMNATELQKGMQFAGTTEHQAGDLGTFGMGLKSASFSQCKTLTVVTRQSGSTIASRWSVEEIDQNWQCAILDPAGAKHAFDELCLKARRPTCGTLVIWERLDQLGVGPDPNALDEFLDNAMARLETHLGMVFHRFLQAGALAISIITRHHRRSLPIPRPVRPLDPFDYPVSGHGDFPKTLTADLPGVGPLDLKAHIWPAGAANDAFLLGSRKGLEFQGFYFYRNNRLIQAGGWNGVVKNHEVELVLARVAVELPPGGLTVNVQKSALQVGAAQPLALLKATDGETTLPAYLEAARTTYRAAQRGDRGNKDPIVVPGAGLPARVQRSAIKRLAKDAEHDEVAFAWAPLDDDIVFDIDFEGSRIVLNDAYRKVLREGSAASQADVPFFKMLLFLLVKEEFGRVRSSKKQRERIDLCNALLMDIVKTR